MEEQRSMGKQEEQACLALMAVELGLGKEE